MAYVASPKYEPYGAARLLVVQMKKAFTAGDCPAAMAHAKEIFEVNLVQIDAHYVTAVCQRKAGNEEEARREHAMLMGLVKSVLGSGDGKSPETAFVVIAIEEEYSVLATFSLTLVSQALVNLGASAFDRMQVKKRELRRNRNTLFQRRPAVAEQVATEEAVGDRAVAVFSSR